MSASDEQNHAKDREFQCPECRAMQPEPGRCGRCPGITLPVGLIATDALGVVVDVAEHDPRAPDHAKDREQSMLRDEAIEWLLSRLEKYAIARVDRLAAQLAEARWALELISGGADDDLRLERAEMAGIAYAALAASAETPEAPDA